jgi:uncharacterized protein
MARRSSPAPAPVHTSNPFRYRGPLQSPSDIIDRAGEREEMLDLIRGGHALRMIGPRRYGKTTLLTQLLRDAERAGMAGALVDLEDVLSIGELVVRIERAYANSLKGGIRSHVEALFRIWNVGLSLTAGGFTARITANPRADSEAVLLRLLDLPRELHQRTGKQTLIVFDEVQDILAIPGADGKIRSVIQHHENIASYAFAGSAPGLMDQLFSNPKRPLLEQAVGLQLAPLPLDQVADYVDRRFRRGKRRSGPALQALIELTRGHPQRTMLLAHFLWKHTPAGARADEQTFLDAQHSALIQARAHLRAIFKALKPNEKRVMVAMANLTGSPREAANAAAVGIRPGSVSGTIEALKESADLLETDTGLRITDPLLELWLNQRGLAALPSQEGEEDRA